MATLTLASAKGAPGVTTTALALSSWWHRPLIVLEADTAGGDLAARLGLSEEPGLVGLAAALRRRPQDQSPKHIAIDDYVQEASTGVRLIPGPAGSHQATSAVRLLSGTPAPQLPPGTDLLVDVGRTSDLREAGGDATPDLPRSGWVTGDASDLFIWICRPQLADLAHLAATLDQRGAAPAKQVVVLVGAGPYPAHEVAGSLGLPVLSHLPADSSGTAALWSGGGRIWARSAIGRASKSLAGLIGHDISGEFDEVPENGASEDGAQRTDDTVAVESTRSEA
jgi:hypothetical protein